MGGQRRLGEVGIRSDARFTVARGLRSRHVPAHLHGLPLAETVGRRRCARQVQLPRASSVRRGVRRGPGQRAAVWSYYVVDVQAGVYAGPSASVDVLGVVLDVIAYSIFGTLSGLALELVIALNRRGVVGLVAGAVPFAYTAHTSWGVHQHTAQDPVAQQVGWVTVWLAMARDGRHGRVEDLVWARAGWGANREGLAAHLPMTEPRGDPAPGRPCKPGSWHRYDSSMSRSPPGTTGFPPAWSTFARGCDPSGTR